MVILITGTSKGLGRYLAEYYLKKTHTVIGCSLSANVIMHPSYHHTQLDLSNESNVRSWVNSVRKKFQTIDVLICNAAIVSSALFLTLTPGNLMESFLKTNVAGVFYVLREVSKQMIKQKRGRIIAISSITTATHQEGTSVYSATKCAVNELIKILAKEVSSSNITCNVIAPGMMKTNASEELAKKLEWEKEMLQKQTIQRVILKEEVAHVSDFLISPRSSSITGQVIYLGLSN
ncbi:SDR family oxidoreductase [Flavobacteriaceae bacterium]|jgi:3-oxoacyl-[acyl-carrier protein] reductase|nr:SDR family oxidoreductase [Flavobacteriaceae bacterium]